MRPIADDVASAVVEAIRGGMSKRRAAIRYRVSRTTVFRLAVRHGLIHEPLDRRAGAPIAAQMYRDGASLSIIARKLGIAYTTARAWIIDEGVEMRGIGRKRAAGTSRSPADRAA